MLYTFSESETPEKFQSKHWVHFKTGDSKEYLSVTGILNVIVPAPYGDDWQQGKMLIDIKNPIYQRVPSSTSPTDYKSLEFITEQWLVLVTPCAISYSGSPNWPGWHIDRFEIPNFPVFSHVLPQIEVSFALQNRNLGGIIFLVRVAYELTLVCRTQWVDEPQVN